MTNADCKSPISPVCDPKTALYVACVTSSDCGVLAPICNSSNDCVGCTSQSDCVDSAAGAVCKAGLCLCSSPSDCAGSAHGKVCDPMGLVCSCLQNTDCAVGNVCLPGAAGWGPPVKWCTKACTADTDCTSKLPKCDVGTGRCGVCNADADCATSPQGPVCRLNGFTGDRDCGCKSAADCATSTAGAVCTGVCVKGCSANADCSAPLAPVCDPATSLCAACKGNADCSGNPTGPVCEKGGLCGCASTADCATAMAGTVCVNNPSLGKLCGCKATKDCPMGKICDPASLACK